MLHHDKAENKWELFVERAQARIGQTRLKGKFRREQICSLDGKARRQILALGELEAGASAALSVFLSLDCAWITCQEAGLFQGASEIGVHAA